MEQQTTNLTTSGQQDRTISITCTPVLTWTSSVPPYSIGGTMTYAQTGSNPNMPNAVDRQSGDIDIKNMPKNANYTDNIDIYLTLDTSQLKDPNGNPVTGRWTKSGDVADPNVNAAWFITYPLPTPINYTPITPPTGMTIDRQSDTLVVIDDDSADGAPACAFCTGLTLPDYGTYVISFEPIISGKGKTTLFMLKE